MIETVALLDHMRERAIRLFYLVVPDAKANGHPGARGWGGNEPPPKMTVAQRIVHEIEDTLAEIKKHV